MKRAELQAGAAGVRNLDSYALEELLISFDPAQQQLEELVPIAVSYAQETGSELSEAAVQAEVKLSLLNLADARGVMKLALSRCQTLSEREAQAAEAFSMGSGSRREWYEAAKAFSYARAELFSAMAEFSKQANRFNQLTGGWVSRTFDWHKGVVY